MVRTQIQLTEEQVRRLRAQACERGLSLAEIVRRYVERGLAEETSDRSALYDRASRLVGRFRDRRGATNVSSEHVGYLDEAFR